MVWDWWVFDPVERGLKDVDLAGWLVKATNLLIDLYIPLVWRTVDALAPHLTATALLLLSVLGVIAFFSSEEAQRDGGVHLVRHIVVLAVLFFVLPFSWGLVEWTFQMGFLFVKHGEGASLGIDGRLRPDGTLEPDGAAPTPGVGRGFATLAAWREEQKEKFYRIYRRFKKNGLLMAVEGGDVLVKPSQVGLTHVLPGGATDGGRAVDVFFKGLSPSGLRPHEMLSYFELAHGVFELAVLVNWLVLLFLIPAFKLCAPFATAVAVHPSLRDNIVVPYLKGLLISAFLLPVVALITEGVAYYCGFLALSLFKVDERTPAYVWDAATMQVVAQYSPQTMLLTCTFIFGLASLCLLMSPYVTYRVANGGVFNVAVGTVAGWALNMASMATALLAVRMQAAFDRAAQHIQASGSQEATLVSAGAAQRAANVLAGGRYGQREDLARSGASRETARSLMSDDLAGVAGNLPPGAWQLIERLFPTDSANDWRQKAHLAGQMVAQQMLEHLRAGRVGEAMKLAGEYQPLYAAWPQFRQGYDLTLAAAERGDQMRALNIMVEAQRASELVRYQGALAAAGVTFKAGEAAADLSAAVQTPRAALEQAAELLGDAGERNRI